MQRSVLWLILICHLVLGNTLSFGASFKPGELLIKTQKALTRYAGLSAQSITTYNSNTVDPILYKYKMKAMTVIEAPALLSQSAGQNNDTTCVYKLEFTNTSANILDIAQEFSKDPEVLTAQPNYIYKANFIPNDPLYSDPGQWGIPDISAPDAWDIASGNSGTKIAIIDTGVSSTHPDLQNKLSDTWNFVDNTSSAEDYFGHGTHVAGIAAANTNNGIGVSGVAPLCSIMNLKAGDSNGLFDTSTIITAITYAINHHASVINMSLGGTGQDTLFRDKVASAIANNIPVVAAAGNESTNVSSGPTIPASYPNVIAVSAINSQNQFATLFAGFESGSNYGSRVDISAPGDGIRSTLTLYNPLRNGYGLESGTSMSTPFVAGVIGLIKSVSPNITISQLYQVLTQSATDAGTTGKDNYYGYGIVNAKAALLYLNTSAPVISHTPITHSDSNIAIPLSAIITDHINWANSPSSSVYYRAYNTDGPLENWQSIKMKKAGTLYTATIPTPSLYTTSIHYYIVAIDPKFTTTLPTQGASSPNIMSVQDLSGPVISSAYKNQDFLSKNTPLIFTLVDNLAVSRNTILVTITSQAGATSYSLSNSMLSFSSSTLSIDLSQLTLPSAGDITITVAAQDTLGNASSSSIVFRQSDTELQLYGPDNGPIINGPNPFNPLKENTYIAYNISLDATIQISIYSLNLKLVKQLTQQDFAGYHEVAWNGRDESGDIVPNGVYLMVIKASANGKSVVKRNKIAVLR